MMSEEELSSSLAYRNFANSCRSATTRTEYTKILPYYMNFIGRSVSYTDLIQQQDPKIIQQNIINWIQYLKEDKKLSSATINTYLNAVKHFYSFNDITLN
jgi:site-specific recombinase XerD